MQLFRRAIDAHGTPVNLEILHSGADALDRVKGEGAYLGWRKPDLIILDLELPRADGVELLAKIKEDPVLRLIPVVVFTHAHEDADINEAYDLHANCYIRKPADIAEYMRAVKQCELFWLGVVQLPTR